jgi:cytochrome c peroxidase
MLHTTYRNVLRTSLRVSAWTALAVGAGACGGDEVLGVDGALPVDGGGFAWNLPEGFPIPRVPADNPMTEAKVELGRHLFYDVRLSGNETQACASCHVQSRAFSVPAVRPAGSTGEVHPRNSMSLANVGYQPVLNWANPLVDNLSEQALIPLFGEDPVELGMAGREQELLGRLRADATYQQLFAEAYPGEADPFTIRGLTDALASFQRTLVSGDAPVDRKRRGDRDALDESAQLGEALFFSERLECFHCHGGLMFTGTSDHAAKSAPEIEFHNTGLYNIDGEGGYPWPNTGLHEFTGRPEDMGRFKAPSLRNVALTAPYMHDGSVATLDEVIDHYAAGGRTIATGPDAGDGSANPFKSGFVKGFSLNSEERRALIDYMRALTDSTFITNPDFSNPWAVGTPARPQGGR